LDVLGAGAVAVIATTGTDDLFGFRRGFIPGSRTHDGCCGHPNAGRDGSHEIYTADVKLGGPRAPPGLDRRAAALLAVVGDVRVIERSISPVAPISASVGSGSRSAPISSRLGARYDVQSRDVGRPRPLPVRDRVTA